MNEPAARPQSQSPVEPAQGTIDTETKYRDRPSDDGKQGDAAAQPRPNAAEDTPGRPKSGASRQQTQPNQGSQTGDSDIDSKSEHHPRNDHHVRNEK